MRLLLMLEMKQRSACGSPALSISSAKTSYFHFDLEQSIRIRNHCACLIVSGIRKRNPAATLKIIDRQYTLCFKKSIVLSFS